MATTAANSGNTGWAGLKRGQRANPLEWLVERLIFMISLTAILMILLIFVFIGREALPVLLGRVNTALVQKVLPVSDLERLTEAQLCEYLGLTHEQFVSMDHDTLKTLMELKVESTQESSKNKDAALNTARWPLLLGPHQWSGYTRPEYIWQPVSEIPSTAQL